MWAITRRSEHHRTVCTETRLWERKKPCHTDSGDSNLRQQRAKPNFQPDELHLHPADITFSHPQASLWSWRWCPRAHKKVTTHRPAMHIVGRRHSTLCRAGKPRLGSNMLGKAWGEKATTHRPAVHIVGRRRSSLCWTGKPWPWSIMLATWKYSRQGLGCGPRFWTRWTAVAWTSKALC